MATENAHEGAMIIHLAVMHNNLIIIRYLLQTPNLFNLDEEGNENGGSSSLRQSR